MISGVKCAPEHLAGMDVAVITYGNDLVIPFHTQKNHLTSIWSQGYKYASGFTFRDMDKGGKES